MRLFRLVWQTRRHYFIRNLMVTLGVTVSTAVLTGALITGDSVRYSLQKVTLERLGSITHLITVKDRYFRADLAGTISDSLGVPVAPVMILEGSAISGGGVNRVNRVQVTGIDSHFDVVAGFDLSALVGGDKAVISENLALKLGVTTGDPVLVRMAKASVIPLNTPFVTESGNTVPLRIVVSGVAGRSQMGGFNLTNIQSAPYNIFISLDRLNRLMELEGRANRMLVSGDPDPVKLEKAVIAGFLPEDAGLRLKTIGQTGETEISSDRIFVDEKSTTVFSALPGSRPVMTYFVNSLRSNNREVPYSFVSSFEIPRMKKDEILVNEWVASDLDIAQGDTLVMAYYEVGALRQVTEKKVIMRVGGVVPMTGTFGDRDLMPPLPGLADAGHCREWDAGIPIDLSRIRQEDEDYWNTWRGTPKAFISPELAAEIWSNRFGNATAIRFPPGTMTDIQFRTLFKKSLTPADFGFFTQAVKEEGMEAARNGVDFGQLFLGLSFFLLLAAVVLTSLLFSLTLENRKPQMGTLLQMGYTQKKTAALLAAEALMTALPGVFTGLVLALLYVSLVIRFLNSLWWDIVRTPSIYLKADWLSLAAGCAISLVIAMVALWIPLRRFLKQNVAVLHKNLDTGSGKANLKNYKTASWLMTGGAVLIPVWQMTSGPTLQPGLFFLSGGLLLGGLLLGFRWRQLAGLNRSPEIDRFVSGRRLPVTFHPSRDAALVALFALATFLVVSTGANRKDLLSKAGTKTSGTGGYSLFAETAVPVLFDLNDRDRRKTEGLDTTFRVVQFHKIPADDASCLNLNRVTNPSILGVQPSSLDGRFSFERFTNDVDKLHPWLSLSRLLPGGLVPAIADQTVIQWGLGLKPGDTLVYQTETGTTLTLKLVGGLAPSIFQGHVLIDNAYFLRSFPSHSGSSIFLVETPAGEEDRVAGDLRNLLRDYGAELTPAPGKLAEFYSVTNTYLSIFLVLGALGIALGTIGLSVVLARSVLERKRELAILLATGYSKMKISCMLFRQYAVVLATGALIGMSSAAVAIFPGISANNNLTALAYILALVAGILLNGFLWIAVIAAFMVKPEKLTPALNPD